MKLFGKKRPEVPVTYDPETEKPVLRVSICTGETVAGFRDLKSGHFREVTLIPDQAALEAFACAAGVKPETIEKIY